MKKIWKNTSLPCNVTVEGLIVYYVMRSKNEVLCAVAGRAKAHKTIFVPNNIQGIPKMAD
jgi:hypothetical protein